MNRWEALVHDYERAIAAGNPGLAAHLLTEFALTAPGSSVRRHYDALSDATDACTDDRIRQRLTATLKFVRQRGAITDSPLGSRTSKRARRNRTGKSGGSAAAGTGGARPRRPASSGRSAPKSAAGPRPGH